LANVDDDEQARTVLQTYPNKVAFGTESNFAYSDLEALYSGALNIKVNRTVELDGFPMLPFRHVPDVQKIDAVTITDTQNTQAIEQSGFDFTEALVHFPTYFKLRGNQDLDIYMEYAPHSGIQVAQTASGYTNKLVFVAFGFLLKGAAV